MALRYCFESSHIPRTLAKCRKNDLAVVDTEGHEKAERQGENLMALLYCFELVAVEEENIFN